MAVKTYASLRTNTEFQGKIPDRGCMSLKHLLGPVAGPNCSRPFKMEPAKPQEDNYMMENNSC